MTNHNVKTNATVPVTIAYCGWKIRKLKEIMEIQKYILFSKKKEV